MTARRKTIRQSCTASRAKLALIVAAATMTVSLLGRSNLSFAAAPEVRGTWVTTTGLGSGNISSNSVTATTYSRLRNIGLNTTYTDLWRGGYTQFSSPTMQALIGAAKDPAIGSRDIARETTMQAHRNGMLNIGWLQYGFATQFQPGAAPNALTNYMSTRGWLLKDTAGSFTNSSNSFAWMNPLVPEVRSLLTNIALDAIKQYDLDGIQFDDRLAWPVQFGYDDYTRNAYKAEHNGADVPASYSNSTFKAWRSQKITEFAQQFIADIKAKNPAIIISASPSVYPFGYDNYCANYPDWRAKGMFDEFIPQVYRNTATIFDQDWDGAGSITTGGQVQFMGPRRADFAAGISINTSSGTANPWAELQPMVNQVRNTTDVAGHVWWYSAGVLTYESQLTSYYNVAANGQAPRADVPTNWRPASIIASQQNATTWNAAIPAKGRYWVVYQNASGWFELSNTVLFPGTGTFTVSGATALEVLVDRRFVDADANLDMVVDSLDFTALQTNFGRVTGSTWAQGDFTGDAKINTEDFNLLAANFGKKPTLALPGSTLGTIVPEPTVALGCGALLFTLTARRRIFKK